MYQEESYECCLAEYSDGPQRPKKKSSDERALHCWVETGNTWSWPERRIWLIKLRENHFIRTLTLANKKKPG